ncbi:HAD-like domain-containing protein [Fusarium redolens]|uniref:HAD-like domain-containing protein n=1 Tax=Fusarium redolens TaxID=48865 RepID=A0A9P9HAY7_FUSRE|nr:HAD-like domain-containing protein [Fusarium redolens]KAH7253523.1 HAD-like domain-containing protein [Fusarium redolens]
MEPTLPSIIFLCKDFAFSVLQSAARAQSPKLAASLDAANNPSQNPVVTVKEFSLDTVNCMVEFFKTGCYEVDRRNFPCVLQAAGGVPALDRYMRDELTCHLQISAIGNHYGVSKLCELARDNIQKVFARDWYDSVFLFTTAIVLKSKDDKLQKMLLNLARGHLHSLTTSNGFDHVTMLKSFHPKFREQDDIPQQNGDQVKPAPAQASQRESSTELESLRTQVASLQQQVDTVCTERDQLRDQVLAIAAEKEELRQNISNITVEQTQSQGEEPATSSKKEELRQRVATVSAERDDLQRRLGNERNKAAQSALKLSETTKTLGVFQQDLRVVTSEKNLLRSRWQDVKEKLSTLSKEHDELKKTQDSVLTSARGELRNALKDEQKESSKLSAQLIRTVKELETRKKSAEAIQECISVKKDLEAEKRKRQVGMSLAERDQIQQALGAEKERIKALTKERDDAKTLASRNFDKDKLDSFLEYIEDIDKCRNRRCKASFGAYIELDGGELTLIARYSSPSHYHCPETDMSPNNEKYVVFDIVGTCVSYDKLIEAVEKQLGEKLLAENVKPNLLVNLWIEAAEREYTYLSITNRYIAFDKLFSSLFYRMLWLAGIQEPRSFASEGDIEKITQGYMELEPRPDLKECFDKLRAAGFTVRGLTAGDFDRVLGYFDKAGIEFPREHLISCDSFGVGKPDLKAYASTFEELKGAQELYFAAAHMWDVSAAKLVGFKSAYCSVLEKEPCVDIFGEMDVMSDSLSEMADRIIQATS